MWALDDGNVDSVVLGDGFLDGQDGWDGATMGLVQEFMSFLLLKLFQGNTKQTYCSLYGLFTVNWDCVEYDLYNC